MIKKAKFLAKEAKLRVTYKMSRDCLFCKIVSGEIKTDMVAEGDSVMAFNDINPISETHIVIIPKKHIDSVLTIEKGDGGDIVDMFAIARQLVEQYKIESYRLAFNGGRSQHVPHLHMHLLAGKKIDWKKL